jgi:hypothetical protein
VSTTGTPVHLDFLGIDHQFRITKIRFALRRFADRGFADSRIR